MSSKGGRKKKSMTDEENVLYMEQKMILEAEAKKRKEDLLNQFLKDKLMKEEKNTRINLNKINYQWRAIMRESKAKELKKDIEILSQTFERIIDRKDSVIKAMVKDLQEAEEQYSMSFRSHTKNVDDLIDIQKEQLKKAADVFEEEVAIIKAEFDKERDFIQKKQLNEMNQLKTIIYGMEKIFLDQENEALIDFQGAKEEIRNKNLEEKQQLRATLEAKVEDLWSQFNRVMKNYEETTEEKKRQFDELKEKDEKSAKEIDMQMRKIQRLSDSIGNLRAKIVQNAKEATEANNAIKDNRDKMSIHFHDLKNQMKQMQDVMRKKLTKLTIDTNDIVKALEAKSEKAKQILQFAEMCRKLETEEEKVLPFYTSSLTEQEENDLKMAAVESPGQQLTDVAKDYLDIENFWKRYNKVLLEELTLEKEKQMLSNENGQLRLLLKQYLDGISVNDEVLTQINPLFIVNNRSNVRALGADRMQRNDGNAKVIVEGTHHIKNTVY